MIKIKRFFFGKDLEQDRSKYFDLPEQTRKQRLLEACRANNVSIYIDDEKEQSSGIYAELRGVASEAELEKRLYSKLAITNSGKANKISLISCGIAVISLIISIASYFK
jgi:hypothetical protein